MSLRLNSTLGSVLLLTRRIVLGGREHWSFGERYDEELEGAGRSEGREGDITVAVVDIVWLSD